MSGVTSKIPVHVHQGILENQLRKIFPDVKIYVEAKKQSKLKYPTTDSYLELDLWIPKHNICFEFQDSYHYITTWYTQQTLGYIQHNDNVKQFMIHQNGITLVAIPCWWDGNVHSLASTIRSLRPDLISFSTSQPISLNPPRGFFPRMAIPEVGELMLASFPLDFKFIQNMEENTWWMGEKYDGVRCCWNSSRRAVYTRSGRKVPLQSSVERFMPSTFIDGEFWFGRGGFSHTFILCKGNVEAVSWHLLRIVAFDVPSLNFQHHSFEKRYARLLKKIRASNPVIKVASRMLCANSTHVHRVIGGVIDEEGEGVILRRVGSLYEHGRNPSLIKIKTSHGDTEALVVGVDEENSVLLKLPSGQIFSVPHTHVHTPTQPPQGAVVTFSYEVHTRRDLPVNPEIYRIREDISWEEVLLNSRQEKKFRNEFLQNEALVHPRGYWTPDNMRTFLTSFAKNLNNDPLHDEWHTIPAPDSKGGRAILSKFEGHTSFIDSRSPEVGLDSASGLNSWKEVVCRRQFFENYAKENSFDPLIPENWYLQSREWLKSVKGVHSVLSYYDNSVSKALLDLFPEIGLDKTKFINWPMQYAGNRRQFFENIAKQNGFDPLDPENWYPISDDLIVSQQEGKVVVSYHENSVSQALMDLFPEIGLGKSKFWGQYVHSANRRKFFKNYARARSFDPLNAEMWYSQSRENIMNVRGATKVISFHSNSLANALADLLTTSSLDRTKLHQIFEWPYAENRRKFFITFAKENKFDPLVPENWYTQVRNKMASIKGVQHVLSFHDNSLPKALLDLFPSIGLNKDKFVTYQRLWNTEAKRRKFFENYAEEQGFDPLKRENWYFQSSNKIMATKGAQRVLFYHQNNISKALFDLFPEVGLDRSKFRYPQKYWNKAENRRKFFENYAHDNKFDPLVPGNWYSHPTYRLSAEKGAQRILSYHRNSVIKALLDLFPEIGLDRSKFIFQQTFWTKLENRRKLFEDYAKENDFDPLVAENWYLQPSTKLLSTKEIQTAIYFHKHSLVTALLDLFPNIGLDQSKFFYHQKFWHRMVNRRKFFEKFAKDNNFDPLIPENWYSQSFDNIMSNKGAQRVLHYHRNNIATALLDLFPNIGLDATKMTFPKSQLFKTQIHEM